MLKRLALNAFSNYSYLIVSIVIALFMSPFLVHTLGDFYYGVWSVTMAITGYFSLLDLGMNRAIVRYVSKYSEAERWNDLNVFFNTSLVIFTTMGIVIAVFSIIISFCIGDILNLKEHVPIAKKVVLIAGMDFAFSFPVSAIYAVLIAKQRHTVANKINIVNALTRNLAIYITISITQNIVALALCGLVFNFLKNIYIFIETKKVAPEIKYNFSLFSKKIVSKIFGYSIYSFAASVSSRIINFTDEIIIGHFLKVEDVTFYAIAVNLISYFEKIVWSGASVFVPYISTLEASKDKKSIENAFFMGTRYTLLLTLFIFYGILFLGQPFIALWMGKKYAVAAFPVLVILATAKVVSHGQSMTMARLFGTSKHKGLGILNTLEAFSNLVLSLVLVGSLGMLGVAYGTLIPGLFFNGVVLPFFTVRVFQLHIVNFFRKALLGPCVSFLLATSIAYNIHMKSQSFGQWILAAIVYSAVFIIIALIISVDKKHIQKIYSKTCNKIIELR